MEGDNFISIMEGIRAHMDEIGYDVADINIVGGEPTMMGLQWYQENIPIARNIFKDVSFTASIKLISNLLDEMVFDIAPMFDVVSTSYEPDTRFVSACGVPKPKLEQKWLKNVKKMVDMGVNVGVTTAVTKSTIGRGAANLIEYFVDSGIRFIHFGFFIPQGDGLVNIGDMFPAFGDTSQFMIDAATWALDNRNTHEDVFINPFESMLSSIANGEALDDIVCPIITGCMDIDWDGNAATCIEAGGATDAEWLGNVYEQTITEVSVSDKFMAEVRKAQRPQRICVSCDEYKNCKSGCGVLFNHWDPNLDDDCPGFKRFIKFVREQHDKGIKPRYMEYQGGIRS
jgi:radical SAM protein with 4Fe4S-binding SPASM domain